jgi:predicted transcriptional regulator
MNTLWPMGEGTVREIRDRLAERRPRAYTTIMTIMDRLARKGVVQRRRAGRAYIYTPNLSMEDARAQALSQIIENFFGGSSEALLAEMGAGAGIAIPRARAAAAGVSGGISGSIAGSSMHGGFEVVPARATSTPKPQSVADENAADPESESDERIDDTLL